MYLSCQKEGWSDRIKKKQISSGFFNSEKERRGSVKQDKVPNFCSFECLTHVLTVLGSYLIPDSEVNKKFKVEIKPFSPNGSTPTGNVDDIRKSIEGLRLSPTSNVRVNISDK